MADDSDFDDGPDGRDDDSFDEDFDADDAEDELPGEDDEFDMEAYLKWRSENPDEGVAAPVKAAQDPGAELPEDDDDEDDYDDEDD